jgi:hypothetical protein
MASPSAILVANKHSTVCISCGVVVLADREGRSPYSVYLVRFGGGVAVVPPHLRAEVSALAGCHEDLVRVTRFMLE